MGNLVLSRKRNEKIICQLPTGEEIIINIADIRGDKARIAIDAPKHIPIIRDELLSKPDPKKEAPAVKA